MEIMGVDRPDRTSKKMEGDRLIDPWWVSKIFLGGIFPKLGRFFKPFWSDILFILYILHSSKLT